MSIQTESKFFFEPGLGSEIPSLGLGFTGYMILRMTFRLYGFSKFIGLKAAEPSELITTGILGRMRHPIYTATILLGVGFWLFSPTDLNLVMVLMWFAYLPIGILFEERKLITEFGDHYLTYKKQVPALFPKISF